MIKYNLCDLNYQIMQICVNTIYNACNFNYMHFDKSKLNKIASMTRNAYGRCIHPVGTMADGDSIYACSVGDVISDVNLVGTLSARVMEQAILKAVESSRIDDEEYLKNCL